MPIVPERVKSAYQRHWPPHAISDAMSRNYRLKRRRRIRVTLALLLVWLLTAVLKHTIHE